jgi:hypothetical protein
MVLTESSRKNIDLLQMQQTNQYALLDSRTKEVIKSLLSKRTIFAEELESQTEVIAGFHQETQSRIIEKQECMEGKLDDVILSSKDKELRHEQKIDEIADMAILGSLRFPTMYDRYERVADAHQRTFEWMFRDPTTCANPWSNFSSWLSGG